MKITKGERSRARVYNHIRKHPGVTTSEIADAIILSSTSVRRYVASLVKEGYVKSEEVVAHVLGYKGSFLLKTTFKHTAVRGRRYIPKGEPTAPTEFLAWQLKIMQVLHQHGASTIPELEERTPGSDNEDFQLALAELIRTGFIRSSKGRFVISEVGYAV